MTQPHKPRWRGRLHQIAFFLAIPAGVALVILAPTTLSRLAAAVYAISMIGMWGVSAAYHRVPWSSKGRRRMKRLDHSMIFILIAGTYTPFSLLVLHGAWATSILIAVWVGAIAGIVLKFIRIDGFDVATGALYIAVGWLAVFTGPQLLRNLSPTALGLLITGGLLYTGGALILALKRPDPTPAVFGYHEVWHSMTISACACHYTVIMLLVLSLRGA